MTFSPRTIRMLTVVSILGISFAYAGDAEITQVTGKIVDGFYFVDATLGIELSDDAREAIESGVPLTFVIDFRIEHERRFLWDKNVLALRRSLELAHHALAESYVVTDPVAGTHSVSPSLQGALKALGMLSNIAIGKASDLGLEADLIGRVRAQLDIESLPAPLRPIAYISPSWRIKSDWYVWRIAE